MQDNSKLKMTLMHLNLVEKLSIRQIAARLKVGRKRVSDILNGNSLSSIHKEFILDRYQRLIQEWLSQYPRLKATQIFDRLGPYGYQGSYVSVVRFLRQLRPQSHKAYHALEFLPGQEAQVDWFFFKHERLGTLAGFLYVLSYSRYAWGMFYPRHSFEFFLDGHIRSFEHIKGLARQHRYDNLKSVVLSHEPTVQYNPQFLDFARFYSFSIYLCNPYSGNEKGRVERLIRDIRIFLYGETFESIQELNHKFHQWLTRRNQTLHRSTGKTPLELLAQERLLSLPQLPYIPSRNIPVLVSKTAYVEFETNRYSVPSTCASKKALLIAYPEKIEVRIDFKTVARHERSFARGQIIENPLHFEKLLNQSPNFKLERILALVRKMDGAFCDFLDHQENDSQAQLVAYQLFKLLKSVSRCKLASAVREANHISAYKIKTVLSALNIHLDKEPGAVYPQNPNLLNIQYKPRSLNDYDQPS